MTLLNPVLVAWTVLFQAAPPDDGVPLAWFRFSGIPEAETYAGTRYLWLGRAEIGLVFDVRPGPGHAVVLSWGAKNDTRHGTLTVNGREFPLQGGGYDGFRPLRVGLPGDLKGDRYEVTIRRGADPAGFVSEVRLAGPGGPAGDPQKASHRATLRLQPGAAASPLRDEAFPAMRKAWDTPLPAPARPEADPAAEAAFRRAEENARRANEALYRCRKFVDGWLAHADPATGLIPRNLTQSRDYWNGRDSAADNYPFMVLTCALTDRALFEGRMLEMLRTETRLTCRIDRLPDDYSFSKKGWRREKPDLDAIIFDGAEYVKDGLLPITEWLGPSPWSERAVGIIDDIWKNAGIETPFGKIPTLNFEVNGDLLQACARLFWFTGDRKYLDWAVRLGDYYLLGDHHPTRDLKDLKLGDHSCEVINGLSELYVAVSRAAPERKKSYEKPIHEMYARILEIGRNEHGLLYLQVDTRTGAPKGKALTDNWGYNYDGLYTAYLVDGTEAYREAVRKTLGNLKEHYTGQGGLCQSNTADGYADSIEGAITLLNREPVPSAAEWIDAEIRTMWAKQKPDGVIEGWHGDGNSARTSIMYALWKTQGITFHPWREDVRLGTERKGDALHISLFAREPWKGRLVLDKARHRLHLRLPVDYPRINQFPEWFVAEADRSYTLRDPAAGTKSAFTGKQLQEGVPLELKGGAELRLALEP